MKIPLGKDLLWLGKMHRARVRTERNSVEEGVGKWKDQGEETAASMERQDACHSTAPEESPALPYLCLISLHQPLARHDGQGCRKPRSRLNLFSPRCDETVSAPVLAETGAVPVPGVHDLTGAPARQSARCHVRMQSLLSR